ncbi:histidinol-phosphate transaminase [Thermoleptolyngbya sichuanensis A183]|uniref:Histidinol-phosphate aminotransferase n=1 Tax=Thermoleptolyngbya sichuanensis A183 TaxID=2737172 RepID=A0A6M8BE48_9CYAN|nr:MULTISPECIES: histidinol-phosphate transaminase [Thermoleptolyngbya]QKD83127.1 histidinol-phosphate transaminase [Thermoleptolyngbya sichuanensis A183]
MLPFLRSDLAQLVSYTPHPGGADAAAHGSPTQPAQVDRLDTNESPYDLPEDLKQKLAWAYQHELEANRYPDGGHAALKGAIAQYANQSAYQSAQSSAQSSVSWVTSAHISVSNGSDELIRSLLIATCLRAEGSVLVADPTFSMYGITANTLGVPVVRVGRNAQTFETDLAAASHAIATPAAGQPAIRIVFTVHPNSPTGNALTDAELDWLRSLPPHILVVIDEAYFEFSQQTVLAELPQHPNWVILRTFSKAFRLASHRVGYAIAHPELAATLEKIRLPYNLPSLSQRAAELALAHQDALLAAIPMLLSERDRLFQALAELPGITVWPSAANFLFLRLQNDPAEEQLETLFQSLKSAGTLVRKTCGGLRITIGTPAENQRTLNRLRDRL